MKTRNIFLLALTAILTVACHSWDDPTLEAGMESYGNQYIQETNVVTIDALKTEFKDAISKGTPSQITKPTQIKVIVTGNDEGSNIYKQLYVTDGTGSLYVYIDKSGLFSEAPVGQCMLIELNGLYISGYGKQPTICVPYYKEGSETASSGRMSRFIWQQHFKLISAYEGLKAGLNIKPAVISNMKSLDLEKDCGKLVTLVGVKMKDADGKNTFAPSDGSAKLVGGCVNREINGMSDVVVRTSPYAKFANKIMPTEKINITGIASRYDNTWQIMPRTLDDITMTTGKENVDDSDNSSNDETIGTKEAPLTIAQALEKINALGDGEESSLNAYVKGKVVKVTTSQANFEKYGNLNYLISEDGTESNTITVYSGDGLDGAKFTGIDALAAGDEVIVFGKLYKYVKDSKITPEIAKGNYLVSLVKGGGSSTGGDTTGGDSNVTTSLEGTVLTLINNAVTASTNTASVDLNTYGWGNNTIPTTVTLTDGTTIVFAKGDGGSDPKFYEATKGVRMYAKNTLTITGSSKAIAKVVLNCDSYSGTDYVGNAQLYGTASGNALTIVNDWTGTSGGTQLRVKTIDITYAQ
jgi:hypothetical protein